MIWCNFLHIYQPAKQTKEIFDRVVSESYWPLVKSLLDNSKIKLTLNINGALTERFAAAGYKELLAGLRKASENGQIEFTDSAKYHALLPFLPQKEIARQIKLNRETNQRLIGDSYQPIGFFPPEMAFSPVLTPILEKMGYQWIILDEIAYNGKLNQLNKTVIYEIPNSKFQVFFRERGPSNLIMSAMVRREADLKHYLREEYGRKEYLITGMDGETFGHHRPGLQKLLTQLLTSSEFKHAFISELPPLFPTREKVRPVVSTWASSEKDIEDKIQFASWDDPQNEIQKLQWELQKTVLADPKANRQLLDIGLASDQFFWSSAKPWWSLEEIELGAWTLKEALPNKKTNDLYLQIIAKAFEWQRSGKVRQLLKELKETPRIPFKDKTKDEPWVYDAFLALMRNKMKAAARKENFEEAIIWRDAIWKLETKNDIFDAIHAVDLLRTKIPNGEIVDLMDKYKKQYVHLVSGQPEQRG